MPLYMQKVSPTNHRPFMEKMLQKKARKAGNHPTSQRQGNHQARRRERGSRKENHAARNDTQLKHATKTCLPFLVYSVASTSVRDMCILCSAKKLFVFFSMLLGTH